MNKKLIILALFSSFYLYSADSANKTELNCSENGYVKVYDSCKNKFIEIRPISLRSLSECKLCSTALSADGRFVALSCSNQAIEIWDIQSKKVLKALCGHIGIIKAMAWSNNGKYLAIGSSSKGIIQIWDVQTKKLIKQFNPTNNAEDAILSINWNKKQTKIYVSFASGQRKKIGDLFESIND